MNKLDKLLLKYPDAVDLGILTGELRDQVEKLLGPDDDFVCSDELALMLTIDCNMMALVSYYRNLVKECLTLLAQKEKETTNA